MPLHLTFPPSLFPSRVNSANLQPCPPSFSLPFPVLLYCVHVGESGVDSPKNSCRSYLSEESGLDLKSPLILDQKRTSNSPKKKKLQYGDRLNRNRQDEGNTALMSVMQPMFTCFIAVGTLFLFFHAATNTSFTQPSAGHALMCQWPCKADNHHRARE